MVDEQHRALILSALEQIEQERGLRILFACESGSRAWGFASRDSDFDVRFLYHYPPSRYLHLRAPVDAFDVQLEGDLDVGGWDVRKTAELMRRSNPPLMEWIDSPIIYRTEPGMHDRLRDLRSLYFDAKKACHHYLSMAINVWRAHLKDEPRPVRKKYLYALRPLACIRFIAAHRAQPPTAFEAVLDGIDWPAPVMNAVRQLVADKKMDVELGASEPDRVLNEHIERSLAEGDELAAALAPNDVTNQALDEFVSHIILGPAQVSTP